MPAAFARAVTLPTLEASNRRRPLKVSSSCSESSGSEFKLTNIRCNMFYTERKHALWQVHQGSYPCVERRAKGLSDPLRLQFVVNQDVEVGCIHIRLEISS